MYRAKMSGRNCIRVYDGDEDELEPDV